MRSLYCTKFLVLAIHFIVIRQDVLQNILAFWMLQSDSVLSSSSCFPCEDQSLLVGMNAFLVFLLMMTSLSRHYGIASDAAVIWASKLHHFFTRASWATTVILILTDQLLAFIAERHDRRCDAEKLRVLSGLKTCVFLLLCKPLAS